MALRSGIGSGFECIVTDGQSYKSTDLIIVGKIDCFSDPSRSMRWLAYMADGKNRGAKILIDYTDNHLGQDSPVGRFYKAALNLADGIIVSSELLRDQIRNYFSGYSEVIEDPIEVEIIAPKRRTANFPSALWFGHASNLPYLIAYLEKAQPSSLKHLTTLSNFENCPLLLERLMYAAKNLKICLNITPWTVTNVVKTAKRCDVSIIPAGLYDDRKKGASSNRLITSFALGLPTAADPIQSYREFKDYFFDLNHGNFPEFFKNFEKYQSKLIYAQEILRSRFTKDLIGIRWIGLLRSVAHSRWTANGLLDK